jgi:type II secretory pathway component PulF
VNLRQRIRFYQQLAVLMRAGLLIRGSLERMKDKMPSPQLSSLLQNVTSGERLGDAFTAARFSPFECHLVTAGEKSGHLDSIFEHLADFWNRELEMRRAIVRPLYYPIVVIHVAILTGFVVDAATTSVSVAVVHFILAMAFLYTAGFVIYTLVRVSWSSEIMQRFWLYVPFVGKSLTSAYAYRWITALRLEFGAGISLYKAVGDAWRASGFVGCRELAEEGELAMQQGADLSKLVLGWRQLPRDWVDFIETGEISGKFDEAFVHLEEAAGRHWKATQKTMEEWLPKILYFVALLIAAVVVGNLVYKVEVAPMVDAEKEIEKATNGN